MRNRKIPEMKFGEVYKAFKNKKAGEFKIREKRTFAMNHPDLAEIMVNAGIAFIASLIMNIIIHAN